MAALAGRAPDPLYPLTRIGGIPISPEAARTIDRALSFRAEARPQSMAEFRKGLGWEGEAGSPRIGLPTTFDRATTHGAWRTPVSLLLAALAGLALGAGGYRAVVGLGNGALDPPSTLAPTHAQVEQLRREAEALRERLQKSDELREEAMRRTADQITALQQAETALRRRSDDRLALVQKVISETVSEVELDLLAKIEPSLAPQITARKRLIREASPRTPETREAGFTLDGDLKLAEAGDINAIYRIAARYRLGNGVAKDLPKAREWLERAAAKGSVSAMADLGVLNEQGGPGIAADFVKARAWYEKAAAQRYPRGMYGYARLLSQGSGGPPNHALAAAFLLEAAKGGDPTARNQLLGSMNTWLAPTRAALRVELVQRRFLRGPAIGDLWDADARHAFEAYLAAP
jgi:TPR repeat protein